MSTLKQLENLTWRPHPQISDLSLAWYKGHSIVCDNSHDKKWFGSLYEVLGDADTAQKAHSLEQIAEIIG